MAKKNKKKEPAKPRRESKTLHSLSALLNEDINTQKAEQSEPKQPLLYSFTPPASVKFITNDDFLNCYNFIPLPKEDCVRGKKPFGTLTGSIHCTITPRTDIFIPNTSNKSCCINGTGGQTVREFFSYQNLKDDYKMTPNNAPANPVIPGSEIRGMIRSLYEAFTNSCMSALDFNKHLSSRFLEAFEPAVLIFQNEKWTVYRANCYHIPESSFRVYENTDGQRYIKGDNGQPIYSFEQVAFAFKTTKKGTKYVTSISNNQSSIGYLVIGEPFIRKRNEFIFTPVLTKPLLSDNATILNAIERYNNIIKEFYRDKKINKTKKRKAENFYKGREISQNPTEGTVIPVWYRSVKEQSENSHIYLSPACIGRKIFTNDFLAFTHSYSPCQGEELCPCCQLFGMVGETNATGSRIRFSDAKFTGSKPEYQPITTLKELSSPKPTSMEVYTHIKNNEKHSGGFWNYDIYSPDTKTFFSAVEYIDINGRKMYYHHPNCHNNKYYSYQPEYLIAKNCKRLITVRPLKGIKTNRFEFDIFFEHITETELKMLLIVTSLMFNQSDYCHKIGMGKPIGLGSIKITVDNVKLRTIRITENGISYEYSETDKYKNYYDYDDNDSKQLAEELVREFLKETKVVQSVFEQIKKMTYFNFAGQHRPQYPQPKTQTEIFKWFSNNRKFGNQAFEQVLDYSGILRKN